MKTSIKKNILSLVIFVCTLSVVFAIATFLPNTMVKAEEISGFHAYFESVEDNGNGDKLLKFECKVGSDWIEANPSSVYTFGAIIFPYEKFGNGVYIDYSKTLSENVDALDGVNVTSKTNQVLSDSFTYTTGILFDKETLSSWILSKKPELENDESGLATALNKVYEHLNYKTFSAIPYAITDNGVIYSIASTSASLGGMCYVVKDNSYAVLLECQSNQAEVEVLDYYEGYPVTYISMAFDNCTLLESVKIPDTVTDIGMFAFNGCTSLKNVELSNNLTNIGYALFQGCTSLESIKIPDSVTSIDSSAFSDCTSLKSIEIPDGVTSIGSSAFSGCTSLESIDLPDKITSIRMSFYGCTSLKSIEIPESVTSIDSSAFSGCTSLESVDLPSKLTSIGDFVFHDCTSLKSIEIPDSVIGIGSSAFRGCTSLNSVFIGNGVTSIEDYTFYGCTSLTSVTLGESITSISDNGSFGGCTLISYVNYLGDINDWVEIEHPFAGNLTQFAKDLHIKGVLLTEVELSTATTISRNAFYFCKSIKSVEIPATVTSIGDSAFCNCTSLESVEIPATVASIDDYAFCGCTSLESVEIPNSVTNIGNRVFSGCSSLKKVTIPDTVTSMGNNVFTSCSKLEYNVKDNIKYLGNTKNPYLYLFSVTYSGTTVEIDSNCRFISESAFRNFTTLESVIIPDTVTSIGQGAFQGCSSLAGIEFNGTTTQWNNITKYYGWNYNVPATKVICSDGEVEL